MNDNASLDESFLSTPEVAVGLWQVDASLASILSGRSVNKGEKVKAV